MEYLGIIIGLVAIAIIQLAACGGSVLLFLRSLPLAQEVQLLRATVARVQEGPGERKAQVERLGEDLAQLRTEMGKISAAQHADRGRYGDLVKRMRRLESDEDDGQGEEEIPDLLSQLGVPTAPAEPAPAPRRSSFGKSALGGGS